MSTKLVGILNITPDSFSDGGAFMTPVRALEQAQKLFANGADIVDVGAESTNPMKTEPALGSEQELTRLLPVLKDLLVIYPGRISVDSYHPETISTLCDTFGNTFIANDVTGMNNPLMRKVVASNGLRCFVSHLPARFGSDIQAAHRDHRLSDIKTVREELLSRRKQLIADGLEAEKIILDPGIGFGKTMQLNWELLSFAALVPDIAVMIGYSRKRFLAIDPRTGAQLANVDRYGTAANLTAAKVAIQSGAAYLRVHDIAAHRSLTS